MHSHGQYGAECVCGLHSVAHCGVATLPAFEHQPLPHPLASPFLPCTWLCPLQASQRQVCCRAVAIAQCRASPAPCPVAAVTLVTLAAARTLPTPHLCALAWPSDCWMAPTWPQCRTA